MKAITLVSLCLWFAPTAAVLAHEVRPAYLELRETAPGTYDVLWKVPALGDQRRLSLDVQFPMDTRCLVEPHGSFAGGAYIERWRIQRPGGLARQAVVIQGLAATKVDVLVRLTDRRGVTQTARATPDFPSVTLEASASRWNVAGTYGVLGVEHILFGFDHLLFVLALLLLVNGWTRLVGTITAFTLAHSLSLVLATLGWVRVPAPPVEACIALSIVFVAAEILHRRSGKPGLTERQPWIVAFGFGLLHGLGFAGALSEVGLPAHAIPMALLFFNLGVEAGQLLFVIASLGLMTAVRPLILTLPRLIRLSPPYAIGAVAMFWVFERVAGF